MLEDAEQEKAILDSFARSRAAGLAINPAAVTGEIFRRIAGPLLRLLAACLTNAQVACYVLQLTSRR